MIVQQSQPLSLLKPVLFISLLSLSMVNAAQAATYCPSGGGYIKPGMTMAAVKKACGEPVQVQKRQVYKTRNIAVKQMIYRLGETVGGRGNVTFPLNTNRNNLTLMINIVAKKVNAISLNGSGVQGATVCSGGPIRVGSTQAEVLSACGTPDYTNHSYQETTQGDPIPQEIWTVKNGQYGASLTLTFNQGILESISN